MRTAIREQLIKEVSDIDGRVYEPQAAGATTQKPYLVIRQGVDTEDTPWTNFRRIVEVWPYLARTTFKNVDAMAQEIISALDKQLLTTGVGEVFSCTYLGTAGQDFVDTEWDALTRGLRFAIMALQPVSVAETVDNDPWLDALVTWTETELGDDWSIYKCFWPLGYARPAILWRIATVDAGEAANRMFQVSKKFIGHVIGITPNQEIAGALQIVEGLRRDIKIPLDIADCRYMMVNDPKANYQANTSTGGQVSVMLSRFTNRPYEEVLLQRVYINKNDGGVQN